MIFPSRSIFLPPLFRFYITTRFDSPRLRFLLSWEDVIIDPFAILFAPDFHERGEKERRDLYTEFKSWEHTVSAKKVERNGGAVVVLVVGFHYGILGRRRITIHFLF